jgi:adenine-specific DNA-methyltransferase
MSVKPKLELTWIGKDNRPKLEPRILIEDPEKSYHAPFRTSENDIYDNRLIFGDNLLALKALEQEFTGKIKCIYIDPPYNTGSAFSQYDDGIEHSIWLTLMRDRLELLRSLLTENGSIWITIDDNECHYLKVLCDEIFGRINFVANVVWQKRIQPDLRATLGPGHDHILVYSKKFVEFKNSLNLLKQSTDQLNRYKNPDSDPKGPWVSADYMAKGYRPNQMYEIKTPSGKKYKPRPGSCWRNIEPVYLQLLQEGRIWFGKEGDSVPRKKTYLSEIEGMASWTWWPNNEVGHNQEAKKEIIALFSLETAFETPKPERLLERIIHLSTSPDDLVLDSFAGSGTTGAVAHKMGRRWIMIELGEHCHTHIIPRLKKVIDGEDLGGVTFSSKKTAAVKLCKNCQEALCEECAEKVGENSKGGVQQWFGGGGFRYYRLAPSLLEKDQYDNWIISTEYNPAMLAEAMCKLEGFTYSPSDTVYWQHGHSTETDFIYVTTQTLGRDQLQRLSDEVGEGRSLLVLCGAFRGYDPEAFANLTVKKIPKTVMNRCEWGHDDYSLEIENLPMKTMAPEPNPDPKPSARGKGERRAETQQRSLFEQQTEKGSDE